MRRSVRPLAPDRPGILAGSVGRAPDSRLRLIAGIAALPLVIVFLRLADVGVDGPQFVGPGPVRSVLERIPARDGRILSSDGQVLAEDIETFSVLVHYRWLERPADPSWLRGEALRSLSRSQRRDREAVAVAERRVLDRRDDMWNSLSRETGLGREEILRRFAVIQERVADLRQRVAGSRASNPSEGKSEPPPPMTWWGAAARAVWKTVTTPPRPAATEPLVLAEELDHHQVAGGLSIAVAATIESASERFPGTSVRVESRRRYPHGSVAAHLIGYRFGRPTGQESEEVLSTGQTGVERAYDRHLRGLDGLRRVWLDRRGESVRSETIREPRVGRDVVLHLDLGLQLAIERLLDAAVAATREAATPEAVVPESAGGCVVALDVRTGAILAAASAPRYDLGRAASRHGGFWSGVLADERRPLFDRVVSAAVPPGSIFKTVSATALLESGRVDPDEPFQCLGYLSRTDRHRDYIYRHFGVGHGPTTLATALSESCNVYFFHNARRIGAESLITWANRFGFGSPTGIDLPGEATGHVSDDARGADVLGLSIGQADLTATPLQIVRMTAAIANGGRLVTPHVVRGNGSARRGDDPARPILRTEPVDSLRPNTLRRLREGLEQVVSHPRGTGYKTVRHSDVEIAGKTGTAEVGGDRADHAWFAGYVPADDPQIAFVVLLEHAGSGGEAAGPVARATVDALFRRDLLRP